VHYLRNISELITALNEQMNMGVHYTKAVEFELIFFPGFTEYFQEHFTISGIRKDEIPVIHPGNYGIDIIWYDDPG
jgi:hypothetical protein